TVICRDGRRAKWLIGPVSHDSANARGDARVGKPSSDRTAGGNICNLMLKPQRPLTTAGYNYATDKINYSRNIKGIHLMFITLWADSAERIWMQKDLDTVASNTPVIIFTHDQPECEAKHFTNPLPPYNMTPDNHFENLTAEHYKEG